MQEISKDFKEVSAELFFETITPKTHKCYTDIVDYNLILGNFRSKETNDIEGIIIETIFNGESNLIFYIRRTLNEIQHL